MKNNQIKFTIFSALALSIIGVYVISCSSKPSTPVKEFAPLENKPLNLVLNPLKMCMKWSLPIGGNLSYMSLTPDGNRLLVSSSSNRFAPKGKEGRVRLFSRAGKMVWNNWVKLPVKGQSVNDDGNISAITTYEDKVTLFDSKGKKFFEKRHLGWPKLLEHLSRLVVVNDDDSNPQTAFFSYSLSRTMKKKRHIVINPNLPPMFESKLNDGEEALDVQISEKYHLDPDPTITVTTSKHRILVFSVDGTSRGAFTPSIRPIKSLTINGFTYVLGIHPVFKNAQVVKSFDSMDGFKEIWSKDLDQRFESIRFLSNGKDSILFLYGNSSRGQVFYSLSTSNGELQWKKSYPKPMTYWSPLIALNEYKVFPSSLIMVVDSAPGINDSSTGDDAGKLNLIGLNVSGDLDFDIPIQAPSGVYALTASEERRSVAVAAGTPGDATIFFFEPCQ